MMYTAIILMHILVWDSSSGKLLDETHLQLPSYATIEGCRTAGVASARLATEEWKRKGHAWAFTNVDCEWAMGIEEDPA